MRAEGYTNGFECEDQESREEKVQASGLLRPKVHLKMADIPAASAMYHT